MRRATTTVAVPPAPEAIPFAAVDPQEWNSVVDRSDEGWIYQRHEWITWASEFEHANHSFGLRDDRGSLVALMPLYEDRPRAGRLFHVRRLRTGMSGPVTTADASVRERHKLRSRIVAAADRIAVATMADILQIQCAMSAPAYWPGRAVGDELLQTGLAMPAGMDPFRPSATLSRFVDLQHADDELLLNMEQNARSAVRQSLRSGLTFEVATAEADAVRYHRLHDMSWRRTGLTPHPVSYFERMWDVLGSSGRMRLFFARSDGRDVAAMILHVYKRATFYWGSCSLLEYQRQRPNNFLMWSAMRAMREEGVRWLEVGAFEPVPTDDTKGYKVGRFKASFGSISVVPLQAQRVYRPGKFIASSAMRAIRDAALRRRG